MPDSITLKQMEDRPQVYIGCDARRKYSIFVAVDEKGKASTPVRVEHDRAAFRKYLRGLGPGVPVAVEAMGGQLVLASR